MRTKNFFLFLVFLSTLYDVHAQYPYRNWVARYNGPGNNVDEVYRMVLDPSAYPVVTGGSIGSTTGNDALTSKYSPSGEQQWAARFDYLNRDEHGRAITTDASGNIYVTGQGAWTRCITIKYNSSGVLQWARLWPGPNSFTTEYGNDIAVDNSGNVYVTGAAREENYPTYDILTAVYNSSGTLIWSMRYNAGSNDLGDRIKVHPSGQYFYVVGGSIGNGTNYDITLIKYRLCCSYPDKVARYNGGGNGIDGPYDMDVDASGNIYITGQSWDYEDSPGEDAQGQSTFITLKYNPPPPDPQQWNPAWIKKYFGSGSNRFAVGRSIGLLGTSHVYVSGQAREYGTNIDYITIKYSSSGTQQWVRRYNYSTADGHDIANSIAVDASGNAYVTGKSQNQYSQSDNRYYDIATIRYDASGVQKWVSRYNGADNLFDEGVSVKVNGIIAYVGGTSKLYSSDKDYITMRISQVWPDAPSGTSENLNSVSTKSNSDTAYACGNNGTILRSIDRGQNWTTQSSGTTNRLNSIYFLDAATGIAVGNNGTIVHTTNGGLNWTNQISGTLSHLYSVHFTGNVGGAAGADGTVLRTTDGGQIWTPRISGTLNKLYTIYFNQGGHHVIAAGESGTLIHSTNEGLLWSSITSGTINDLRDAHFVSDIKGTVVGDNGTILKTESDCAVWSTQAAGTSANMKSVFFLDENTGFACGSGGVILCTTNGGNEWSAQESETSFDLNGISLIDDNTGIIAGNSGKILLSSIGEILTNGEDNNFGPLSGNLSVPNMSPKKFHLSQNYPNPFNPITEIEYSIGYASHVQIKIYNVAGKEVMTIVDEMKKSGDYKITVDGTNLSSGVYFYRMNAGSFTETRKMVIVK